MDLDFLKGWGGYTTTLTLIAGGLLTWWKVLPALIDALANRQSKIEERMGALLRDATDRFSRQIAEADARHADCMEGQRKLLERVEEQDEKITAQSRKLQEQDETIAGLRAQFRSMQVSAVRIEGGGVSALARGMIETLDIVEEQGKGLRLPPAQEE